MNANFEAYNKANQANTANNTNYKGTTRSQADIVAEATNLGLNNTLYLCLHYRPQYDGKRMEITFMPHDPLDPSMPFRTYNLSDALQAFSTYVLDAETKGAWNTKGYLVAFPNAGVDHNQTITFKPTNKPGEFCLTQLYDDGSTRTLLGYAVCTFNGPAK